IETVFIAVVGGLGTVVGPLIGAVFLTTFAELFREHFAAGHLIFYGLCMMLVIRFLPEGIWGRVAKLLARRTSPTLTLPRDAGQAAPARVAPAHPAPATLTLPCVAPALATFVRPVQQEWKGAQPRVEAVDMALLELENVSRHF